MARCNPLKTKLRQGEFYCVSCCKRIRVPADDIRVKRDKRKKPRMVAKCHKCGTKLFKYIKADHEKKLKQKYN